MSDLPCFIGGFRSGTTLLINLLGMHPALVPWFETKELCELLRWLRVRGQPETADFESAYVYPPEPAGFALDAVHARMLAQMRATAARQSGAIASGKASHERYPLGNDWVRYTLEEAEGLLQTWRDVCADPVAIEAASAALIQALGQAQCAGAQSAYWVNKTPEISRFAPQLRSLLGPCRVLYMVRNGLEVVASASRLGWGQTAQLAYNWKGLLELTRAGMAEQGTDYLELRYETLLAEPAATLDRVFGFLGVAPRGESIVAEFRSRYGAGAFAHPGRVELPAAEYARFMAVAGDLQRALGYC